MEDCGRCKAKIELRKGGITSRDMDQSDRRASARGAMSITLQCAHFLTTL